jgi:hypothetical protein
VAKKLLTLLERRTKMPQFPNKEADVVALAEQMIAGLTTHAADFPSVTKATLEGKLADYKEEKQAQEDAKSQVQIATISKDENLDSLVELMKNDLKKAEVDCTNNPQNLTEIGWGPKAAPQQLSRPAVRQSFTLKQKRILRERR